MVRDGLFGVLALRGSTADTVHSSVFGGFGWYFIHFYDVSMTLFGARAFPSVVFRPKMLGTMAGIGHYWAHTAALSSTWHRHVHGWFCWFDAVRAVFSSLVGRPAAAPGLFYGPPNLAATCPMSSRSSSMPYSALFRSTVDTDLCQSAEVSLVYGLCFARDTGTHSANCATSWLDEEVDMPVVVLDRCLVSACRNSEVPQLPFVDQVETSLVGNRDRYAQCNCAVVSCHGWCLLHS